MSRTKDHTVVPFRNETMKLLVKTAGWKIFLAIIIVSLALFIPACQLGDNPAVAFIPAVLSGLFYYCWMYGLATCFGERDPMFAGTWVKISSVIAVLGFLCIWIQPYQIVNQIPYDSLPRGLRFIFSVLRLTFYPASLSASYVLITARLGAEGRSPQKAGFLRVFPRALILTLFPVLAWPFFHTKFRKFFIAS